MRSVLTSANVSSSARTSSSRESLSIVKDTLIFVTIFAAVVIIPARLGGYGAIFASVPQEKLLLAPPAEGSLGSYSAYATLALGSALSLFLYPHSMTGILSASNGEVIRRNAAMLSAYSFILGLIVLSDPPKTDVARFFSVRATRGLRLARCRSSSAISRWCGLTSTAAKSP